jgi:hypothetical protein
MGKERSVSGCMGSRSIVEVNGSVITFSWDSDMSVACKSVVEHSSVKTLVALMESVFISATVGPKNRSKKAFMLSYNKTRMFINLSERSQTLTPERVLS